jgi:hypothetical protein
LAIVYAPHLTSPVGGEVFNYGKVTITWDKSDPPTDDIYSQAAVISYELEYTDHYNFDQTVWSTIKRRIPWIETSYEWIVGKKIKSDSIQVRIRAKNSLDGELSDWSMCSGTFSINVFKLTPPIIASPAANQVYTDYILIILDESVTQNTFNQKVRYSLDYSSESRDVGWTNIVKDIPVGQNVVRWDLEGIVPADDYVLRLTAKNSAASCLQSSEPTPDQIAMRFVYNLKIQQPGLFLIDTKPPEATLAIESSSGITNELIHTLTVYAEDETSEVEQIQIRECDATDQIALGDVTGANFDSVINCPPITELIASPTVNFGKLIGKPLGYSAKTQWTLEDTSGLRKIEALLTDSGGNIALRPSSISFIPIFRFDAKINDIIVTLEERNVITLPDEDGEISSETATYEVAYLITSTGEYYILEPFPRLVARSQFGRNFKLIYPFNNSNFIFTYVNNDLVADTGSIYRDDKVIVSFFFKFPNAVSETNAVTKFKTSLYIGLENGELWEFNGTTMTLLTTLSNPISSLIGDDEYLYIGLFNSSLITVYNGTDFVTSDIDA